jgi:sugar/nucleoside kinase (ribokinase family)
LTYVDIVSPNHLELGAFFNRDTTYGLSGELKKGLIEELSDTFLKSGIGPDRVGCIVVRCGKWGCFIAHPDIPVQDRWLPAFHASSAIGEQNDRVVDPTGGGNAFLGGLSVGLVRSTSKASGDRLKEAAIWGTISASFAIEQVGMPALGEDEQGETWNGVHVKKRIADYEDTLRALTPA